MRIKHYPQQSLEVKYGRESVTRAEKVYGRDSMELLPFLYDLAHSYVHYGPDHYEAALPYLQRAVDILKRNRHTNDLEAATGLTHYGRHLSFTGRTALARTLLTRAAAIRKDRLGLDDFLTGQTYNEIAMMEVLASLPGTDPRLVVSMLSVNPAPIETLPVPAREPAGIALRCYNLHLEEEYGNGSNYTNYNYKPLSVFFWNHEYRTSGFEEKMMDLVNRRKGPCFVATAVYGDTFAPQVEALRKLRDDYLLTHFIGRAFVRVYYRIGPHMAEWICLHPNIRSAVRRLLDALIRSMPGTK